MITLKAKKQFVQILTLGNYAGFSLIKHDTNKNVVVCESSRWYQAWVGIQMCLALAYQLYLGYQAWKLCADPMSPTTLKISTISLTSSLVLLNCNHVVGLLRMKDYTCFINGYQSFMKNHVAQGETTRNSILHTISLWR